MLNKVILIGRLTRDPELRYTANNVSVTTFTLAVNRRFTNQQGEQEADFIPIVTWRTLAETCHRYLNKGRLVAVSGRLQVRSYEDSSGQRRYVTEVVADEVQFLDRGRATDQSQNQSMDPAQDTAAENPWPPKGFDPVDDDELPF